MMGHHCRIVIVGVAATLASAACSSTNDRQELGVVELSSSVVRYNGPGIEALIGFRYARAHLGDEWLVLETSLTGLAGSKRVYRESISIRSPSGIRIPLPSQEVFRESYPEFRVALQRAESLPSPEPFGGIRSTCDRWFFAAPGSGFAFDYVDLRPVLACEGPLVFSVPGGVQPGRWVLEIELEEHDVRIPFTLEDPG
jgi:hypothetical protein